jgi:hypothetical protein
MRPVDFQPAIMQTPNAERAQQVQQSQPQVSQQVFAGEMNRLAEDKKHQVQGGSESQESRAPEELSEKKRENLRHGKRRRPAPASMAETAKAETGQEALPAGDAPHVDVRV